MPSSWQVTKTSATSGKPACPYPLHLARPYAHQQATTTCRLPLAPGSACASCRHHDTLFSEATPGEKNDLQITLRMSKEELQVYRDCMVALEDRLVEVVRPKLQEEAQKAWNADHGAGQHTVPARMLQSFVSCVRLAVRDFPLKLRDASTEVELELRGWGPAYSRRIKLLAPHLQDHPDWASYCAQVQWVAATVAGKRLSIVRHRSDPQHYNNREIDKELQPDPPGLLQQEQQQQQQVAGGGAACSQVPQEQQRQRGREQQAQQLTHPHQKGGLAAAVPQPQPAAAAACQGPDQAFPLGCYCMRDMLVQIISTAEVRRAPPATCL